jgi:hypothetical protein
VGRVTEAKKIFKADDCDNDRHRYYWDKVKAPYIYVRGYLYDDEDHPNARAASAILRNVHKSDCPLKLKASVEGGVVQRGISDPSLLARTKIHSVALTFTPANTATLVEPLNLDKAQFNTEADMVLIQSVMHLAKTDVPSFRHIARDASATRVVENIERIAELVADQGSNIHVPSKNDIIQYALESKIQSNVGKIKEIVHEIKHDELEKGVKSALAGAALAGATALAPTPSSDKPIPSQESIVQEQKTNLNRMPAQHQEAYKKFAQQNPLLGAIGMVESSGGVNYGHKPVGGHAAGGMFGMMPNAAAYILRNNPELATKYPKLAEASKDIDKNHGAFTETFNNDPQAAYDFADALLKRNKGKTKDMNMLIHSWNHGLKGTWNRLKNEGPDAIEGADYVKKVSQAYKKLHPNNDRKPAEVKKALTAGYGGAGAPTNLTQGGVLQSEAVDQGRSFKYITCDGCGKEQVYSKFQVKCRECGGSFAMDKLHKLFLGAIAT